MELKPEFRAPRTPVLRWGTNDKEEAQLIRSIEDNLRAMESECERVVSDVALFQFCKRNPDRILRQWLFLAARDGAMALRDFSEALSAVRRLIGRCPSIKDQVDVHALKRADKEFEKHFPRVEKLRHAAAHPELYANPDVKMSTDEPIEKPGAVLGPGTTIQGSLFNETYVATINGLTVEWQVTNESTLNVIAVAKHVFGAFSALDPWSNPPFAQPPPG